MKKSVLVVSRALVLFLTIFSPLLCLTYQSANTGSVVLASSSPVTSLLFEDDFEGTVIDSTKWSTDIALTGERWCSSTVEDHHSNPGNWLDVTTDSCHGVTQPSPYGTITVSGGKASFGAGPIRTFPYIWAGLPSRQSPFLSTGDFILEVRMKYDSIQSHGDGFQAIFWENTDPIGDNPPAGQGSVFGIWAGSDLGLETAILGERISVSNPLAFHDYSLENIGGNYSLFVDGVLKAGPIASSLRPNTIWIGNPVFTHWGINDWSNFTIDFVRVTTPSVTSWSFSPPYDSCVATTQRPTDSPPPDSPQVIALGFSDAQASCDPETGTINHSTLVFGGKKGHIFLPPTQWVEAGGDMGFEFIPPFSGSLIVTATINVNAELSAAAGSATALPSLQSLILLFLPDKLLKAFIKIAQSLVLETFAATKAEAYIRVGEQEDSVVIESVGASFPMPPWSQSEELSEQEAIVAMTIPVVEGEPVYIQAGLRSESKAYGWAISYWNILGAQDSYVTSIVLTREE